MSAVILRPAVEADLPFLVKLRRITMKTLIEDHFPWDEQAQRDRVLSHFACARIISSEGRDIGLYKVVPEPAEVHLSQIQLLTEYQGRGIASDLIRRLQAETAGSGLPLTLHVLRRNRAISLYTRLGFAVYHEDEHFLFMRWTPVDVPMSPHPPVVTG